MKSMMSEETYRYYCRLLKLSLKAERIRMDWVFTLERRSLMK